MAHVNQVMMEGTLTSDSELSYSKTGIGVLKFNIANNLYQKGKDDYVSFFNVIAFGKVAETMATYLRKGVTVLFTGSQRMETYTNKDNQKVTALKIIIGFGNYIRITSKEAQAQIQHAKALEQNQQQIPQGQQGNYQQRPPFQPVQQGYQQQSIPSMQASTQNDDFEDDIPF